jgi:hypothetical protein
MEIDRNEPEVEANLVDAVDAGRTRTISDAAPAPIDRTQLSPQPAVAQSLPTPPATRASPPPPPPQPPTPTRSPAPQRPLDIQPSDKITVIDPAAKVDASAGGARQVEADVDRTATRQEIGPPKRKLRTEQQTTKRPKALSRAESDPDKKASLRARLAAVPRPTSRPPGAPPETVVSGRTTQRKIPTRAPDPEPEPPRPVAVAEPDPPGPAAPEPAASAPSPTAGAASPWADLTEDIAEIQFLLLQGLEDEARAALGPLMAAHGGHPELESIRIELEAAELAAGDGVDDPVSTEERPAEEAPGIADDRELEDEALDPDADVAFATKADRPSPERVVVEAAAPSPAPEPASETSGPVNDDVAHPPLRVAGPGADMSEIDRRARDAETAEAELSRAEEERREGARRAARAEASARRVTAEEREKIEAAQRAADAAQQAEREADEAERLAVESRDRAKKARAEARRAAAAAEEAQRSAKRAAVSRKVKSAVAEAAKEAEGAKAAEVAKAAEAARRARAAVAEVARQATTGPSASVPVEHRTPAVADEIEIDPSLEIDARSLLHPSFAASLDPYDEDSTGGAHVDSGAYLGAPQPTPLQDSALPLLEVELDEVDEADEFDTSSIDTRTESESGLDRVEEIDEFEAVEEIDEIEELEPDGASVNGELSVPQPSPVIDAGGELLAPEDLALDLDDLDDLAPDPGPARTGSTIPPGASVPAQSGDTVVGKAPSASEAPASEPPASGSSALASRAPSAPQPRTTVLPGDPSQPAQPKPYQAPDIDSESAAASGEFSYPEATEPSPPPMPSAVAQTPDGTVISPMAGSKAAVPVAPVRLVALGAEGQPVAEQTIAPGDEFEIGRTPGTPWAADGNMHGRHVRVRPAPGGVVLHESGEACAVYAQVVERTHVRDGDELKVGQSALYYQRLPDGTDAGVKGTLSVYKPASDDPEQYPVGGAGLRLGRDDADIVFPDDTYVSGQHCRLSIDGGEVFIEDLGSSNGTYLRVRTGDAVAFGTLVLVGHTQFRIEPG